MTDPNAVLHNLHKVSKIITIPGIACKALLIFLIMAGCTPKKPSTRFTLLSPSETNIHFRNDLKETEKMNMVEYLYFNNGGGVAAGDINNDGLVDLYFTSNQNSNRLYLNKGNFHFEDITRKAGVNGEGNWSTGVTMADVNGDGLLDIYVCCVGNYKGINGHNLLYINNGDLTFSERSHDYGLDFSGFSTQAAFFDYDQDGDLDMYLLNHSVHTSRSYGPATLRYDFDRLAGDRLFRNMQEKGKRYFLDVTRRVGVYSSQIGYGLGVSIGDVNNDGYPDIYIDNDFHENDYLYINNRDGTFYDQLTGMVEHSSRSSMGNDMADFNNDGNLDIISLDMLPHDESKRKKSGGDDDLELYEMKLNYGYYFQFVRNMLQLNLGDGHFAEIGRLAGIYSTDWSWTPLFCDLNNDGFKDLFITNGIYRRANDLDYVKSLSSGSTGRMSFNDQRFPDKDLYEKMPLDPLVNYMFENKGDLTFTNQAISWGMNEKTFSSGACYADLDNDGDLDLVINNINQEASVYRNNNENFNGNHFIGFSFKGADENRFGIGARVTLFYDSTEQMEENYTTRGFESSVPPVLLFGTGNTDRIDTIIIRWPGGKTQKLFNVETGQHINANIKNARENKVIIPEENKSEKLFTATGDITGLNFEHRENKVSDLAREYLMPYSLTAQGPCIAVGDVNNDHKDDIFFGNAKGQPSALFIQNNTGFRPSNEPLFNRFAAYEDVDAAFFDADGDGDLDLYIVSGSDENTGNDPTMRDRLLFNDGKGNFTYRENAIPVFYHNGSCVKPADMDGDGDIDLFVGSRSVPGSYGSSPASYLLKNNGSGRFTDVTRDQAPPLSSAGMITDAAWARLYENELPELILSGEWMPITIYKNKRGFLTVDTLDNGLRYSNGWWYCIEVTDLDNDGDMDLVAGNLGLNAGIKADTSHPAKLYINDFDNNGSTDPVITAFRDGNNYPVATADQLYRQIGSLRNTFPTYSSIAGKTVDQILPPDKLAAAVVKTVYNFESGIFINQGNDRFEFRPFPKEAQFSPVVSILMGDFNHDGMKDLILAGNLYEVRPSFGRYDASFGWFLKGRGNDNFNVELPLKSGLMIRGETRRLAAFGFRNKTVIVAGINNYYPRFFYINSE